MSDPAPLVSVVIPVYNREDLLPRALLSLFSQTYTNWEAVVVDDKSKDRTVEVANKFAEKDSRIRVIQNIHSGPAETANKGLRDTKGEFITFLDSDDEYLPEHLAFRVKRMQAKDHPDIIHGGFKVIGDEMVVDKRDTSRMVSLYDEVVVVGPTFFGKREVFKALKGFRNIPYFHDSEFLDRAKKIYKVVRIESPTYIYHREHTKSVTKEMLDFFEVKQK
ncbi:MAG: glycosyltransferase family 2 protein [Candidatus Pacebacteria bacterium]|nr:glycosyltransferase family 2 protein [Candidatus Paceibacterota bacterium]MDD5357056.1 glycosyltransferase family 2 protein [Candidatus Paceibacterota bacterium]